MVEFRAAHAEVIERYSSVLIDFWTYSGINCLPALPYVTSWYDRYKDHGLVVLGIHAPEFAFEKNESNVKRAVRDLGIKYPVALDNNYAIWQSLNNQYWGLIHYATDSYIARKRSPIPRTLADNMTKKSGAWLTASKMILDSSAAWRLSLM